MKKIRLIVTSYLQRKRALDEAKLSAFGKIIEMAAPSSKEDIYETAQSFFAQSVTLLKKESALYKRVSAIFGSLLILSLISISVLVPLEKVKPYLVSLDKRTGEVGIVKPIEMGSISPTWPMTRKLLVDYVRNRENYNFIDLNYGYKQVVFHSSNQVGRRYIKSIDNQNKNSPLNLYGRKYYIKTHIISVSPLRKGHAGEAFVKFDTIKYKADNSSKLKTSHWTVVIRYGYDYDSSTPAQIDNNPLGFKVIYYDKELVK